MTQSDAILQHLKSGKPITGLEALNAFGVFRLAARINDLRNKGFNIQTRMVGNMGAIYAQYYMIQNTPDAYKVQRSLAVSA